MRYRPHQAFAGKPAARATVGALPHEAAVRKILRNRNTEVTMSYPMRFNHDLGCVCHWCGEFVGTKGGLRTGKHIYCENGGKCKMRHFRAFKKCKPRVTSEAPAGPGQAARSGPGGNAQRKPPAASMAAEIAKDRSSSGNKRRRRG